MKCWLLIALSYLLLATSTDGGYERFRVIGQLRCSQLHFVFPWENAGEYGATVFVVEKDGVSEDWPLPDFLIRAINHVDYDEMIGHTNVLTAQGTFTVDAYGGDPFSAPDVRIKIVHYCYGQRQEKYVDDFMTVLKNRQHRTVDIGIVDLPFPIQSTSLETPMSEGAPKNAESTTKDVNPSDCLPLAGGLGGMGSASVGGSELAENITVPNPTAMAATIEHPVPIHQPSRVPTVVAEDWESAGDDQFNAQATEKRRQVAEAEKKESEERARLKPIAIPIPSVEAPSHQQQQQPAQPAIRLLRRPQSNQHLKKDEGEANQIGDELSFKQGGSIPKKGSMTYEQREAAYQQARERIFGKAAAAATPANTTTTAAAAVGGEMDEAQEIDALLNETHISSTAEDDEEGDEPVEGVGKEKSEVHDHLSDVQMVTQENAPLKKRYGGGYGGGTKQPWQRVPDAYLHQTQPFYPPGTAFGQPPFYPPSHANQMNQWSWEAGIYQGAPLYPQPYQPPLGDVGLTSSTSQPGDGMGGSRVMWGQPPPYLQSVPHYSSLPMAPAAPKPLSEISVTSPLHPQPLSFSSSGQKSYSAALSTQTAPAQAPAPAPYGFSRPPPMFSRRLEQSTVVPITPNTSNRQDSSSLMKE